MGLFVPLTVAVLLNSHPGLAASGPGVTPAALTPADSVTTLREAKRTVRVFHSRYRQWAYPIYRNDLIFVCEKMVWPYCFGPANGRLRFGWGVAAIPVQFPTSDSVLPRDVARRLGSLVNGLARDLSAAQKKLPGDRWIMGQRVFHLAGSGQLALARVVASECKGDRWWCAALVGHTSHMLKDIRRADSAFAVALAALPEAERCRWEDLSDLIYDDPDRRWYLGMSCAGRTSANETLWWLADPLYLMPGNERRTAHYSRVVYALLFEDSREALPPVELSHVPEFSDRLLWAYGAFPSLLRSIGIPRYIIPESISPWSMGGEPPLMLLQYAQPTYHFLPTLASTQAPTLAGENAWDLNSASALERYQPTFGRLASLGHQVAFFKRGDSARMIASMDVRGDSALMRGGLLAMQLFVGRSASQPMWSTDERVLGTRVTFDVMTRPESSVVSIEALAAGVGAGRARLATGPPAMPAQRVTASDLLLLDSLARENPRDLNAVLQRVARSESIVQGRSISVFWEVYGLMRTDTVTYSLSAADRSTSALARIGRVVGVVTDPPRPRVQWTEPQDASADIVGRSVTLDLSTMSTGRYTLQLEVRVPGQRPVTVRRGIEIVKVKAEKRTPIPPIRAP